MQHDFSTNRDLFSTNHPCFSNELIISDHSFTVEDSNQSSPLLLSPQLDLQAEAMRAIEQAELRLTGQLLELQDRSDLQDVFETSFGAGLGVSQAVNTIEGWIEGLRPDVKVVDANLLPGVAAFGKDTGKDTVFLSNQILEESLKSPDLVRILARTQSFCRIKY